MRQRVQLICADPSRAIQSQRDEADINNIVRAFGVTGRLPSSVRLPQFGDFDSIDNYQDAVHAVREAESAFLQVPANIRSRFDNDPHAFAAFCLDSKNLPELQKLGLAPAPAPAEPSGG